MKGDKIFTMLSEGDLMVFRCREGVCVSSFWYTGAGYGLRVMRLGHDPYIGMSESELQALGAVYRGDDDSEELYSDD